MDHRNHLLLMVGLFHRGAYIQYLRRMVVSTHWTRWNVLVILYVLHGHKKVTAQKLAEYMAISCGRQRYSVRSMYDVLRFLKNHGLVAREKIRGYHLTYAGRAVIEDYIRLVMKRSNELLADIDRLDGFEDKIL